MMPELKLIVIQTRFEVRKGDEFVRDIAIKGILSSRICCRIASDANMAEDPEKTIFLSSWINCGYSS